MAGIDSFQLLSAMVDLLLKELAPEVEQRFFEASDYLPQELPRRATFGPDDQVELENAVMSALRQAGLRSTVERFLEGMTTALERFAQDPTLDVPPAALDQLQAMLTRTSQAVTEIGGRVSDDVRSVLALAVREPLSAVEMADKLRASLKAEGRYAATVIRTEAKAAQRLLARNTAVANDLTRALYAGHDDPTTRVFCDAMLNWVFTEEQLNGCDNGQLPDVVITMGGYNCQHDLLWLTEGAARRTFPGKVVLAGQYETILIDKTRTATIFRPTETV